MVFAEFRLVFEKIQLRWSTNHVQIDHMFRPRGKVSSLTCCHCVGSCRLAVQQFGQRQAANRDAGVIEKCSAGIVETGIHDGNMEG
jgi:hypothetical protein